MLYETDKFQVCCDFSSAPAVRWVRGNYTQRCRMASGQARCADDVFAARVQQLSGWNASEIDALLTEKRVPGKN